VIHEAHHVLDLAELDRHVDGVARKLLGRQRHLSVPGVPVDELALAGIAQLAMTSVELRGDDDFLHG